MFVNFSDANTDRNQILLTEKSSHYLFCMRRGKEIAESVMIVDERWGNCPI